jgi:ORF6N domain.
MKGITVPNIVPIEKITNKIYLIRGIRVMLDSDLAELYEVETRRLNEQVKRNIKRFPEDFIFQLTKEEFDNLKSQFATSSWGGRRRLPFVFTEQGVAMLSGVLHSDRAIHVNIQIMRAFTQLRKILTIDDSIEQIKSKIESMENKYDHQFKIVFEAIRQLINEDEKPKRKLDL